MTKIRAIVVDDEMAARNVLSNLLELQHPEIELIGVCESLPEAVLKIRKTNPDVVFLDVEMPEFSGYEIINFFDQIDFQIVFVTAYDRFAIKAFEINAVDYILKPIERSRLKSAIEKINENYLAKNRLKDYKTILDQMNQSDEASIMLSEIGEKRVIKLNNILAFSANGSYTEIYLKGGETLVASKNIGAYEEELKVADHFFRSHKSWMVNLREVLSVQTSKEIILMTGGLECKLSRFKKKAFHEALDVVLNHNY